MSGGTDSASPSPRVAAQRPVIALQVQHAPPAGASLRWVLAAPHRLFFSLGMIALAACSLWWLVQLWARTLGAPLAFAVPPSWVHGWAMANGFLPFFMFGFLFTAGPRWLHVSGPPARMLLRPALVSLAGLLLALVAAQASGTLLAIGVLLMAIGWTALLALFFRLERASRVEDRVHARLVAFFFALGVPAQLAFAVGVLQLSADWIHAAQMASIWLFLAPVYVTVAHRLIPFFSASVLPRLDAWRPLWLLAALNTIVIAHGLLPLGSVFVSAPAFGALRLALDLTGAGLLLLVSWRWGAVQSLKNRLLAMLQLGFLWLGIAMALYAWNASAALLDMPQASLGLAPLHALTMGFFGSMAFAMVTRVTAGHSGRPLLADTLTWAMFWTLQAAVLARLLVDVWQAQGGWLTPLAITLWCAALMPWAARSLAIYLRARADGRPD